MKLPSRPAPQPEFALTWRVGQNVPSTSHFSTRHPHSLHLLPKPTTIEQQRAEQVPTTHMLVCKLCECTS